VHPPDFFHRSINHKKMRHCRQPHPCPRLRFVDRCGLSGIQNKGISTGPHSRSALYRRGSPCYQTIHFIL